MAAKIFLNNMVWSPSFFVSDVYIHKRMFCKQGHILTLSKRNTIKKYYA